MEWILLALAATIFMTYQVEANRHFAYDGQLLNIYRGVFATVFMLPLVLWLPWPIHPVVYFIAVIDGIGSVTTQRILYNMAARKQSRVSSLYSPLATFVALALWLVLSEAERLRVAEHPQALGFILLALLCAALGLNFLRRNDASLAAFFAVLPVGFFYGATDVLTRLAINTVDVLAGVLIFCFVSYATMTVAAVAVSVKPLAAHRLTWRFVLAAILLAVASVLSLLSVTGAVVLAPNPAYPGFFIMMMPVLLLLYHRLRGVQDSADWRAGVLIVFGALLALLQSKLYH